MSFLMPKPQTPQMQMAPAASPQASSPPVLGQSPTGKKPTAKRAQPSFLGMETSADSSQQSNKTLLGQ